MTIEREAFCTAMTHGGTTALDAYFGQPHVRAEVDAAEAFIAADDSTDMCFDGVPPDYDTFYYPWYWARSMLESEQEDEFLFYTAVKHDQVEVLQWFFSPAQISYMRATLTRLLPRVAKHMMRYQNNEMLDWLLSSEAFKLLLPDRSDVQSLLHELVTSLRDSSFSNRDMIRILLAHGSDVNSYPWRYACLESFTELEIDVVVSEGMVVVGGAIVVGSAMPCTTTEAGARRLLQLGGDGNTKAMYVHPLHRAARFDEIYLVKLLLDEAFVDVDVRDSQGRTPLMAVAESDSLTSDMNNDPCPIARMLLESGADVMARDDEGRTALYHAIGTGNTALVKMLLNHGADPNALTHFGESVVDCEQLAHFVEYSQDELVLLLEFGMDPFADEWDGESMSTMLGRFEAGAAFVAHYPQHFVRQTVHTDGNRAQPRAEGRSGWSGAVRGRSRGRGRGRHRGARP